MVEFLLAITIFLSFYGLFIEVIKKSAWFKKRKEEKMKKRVLKLISNVLDGKDGFSSVKENHDSYFSSFMAGKNQETSVHFIHTEYGYHHVAFFSKRNFLFSYLLYPDGKMDNFTSGNKDFDPLKESSFVMSLKKLSVLFIKTFKTSDVDTAVFKKKENKTTLKTQTEDKTELKTQTLTDEKAKAIIKEISALQKELKEMPLLSVEDRHLVDTKSVNRMRNLTSAYLDLDKEKQEEKYEEFIIALYHIRSLLLEAKEKKSTDKTYEFQKQVELSKR